jgi:hypothetical protein
MFQDMFGIMSNLGNMFQLDCAMMFHVSFLSLGVYKYENYRLLEGGLDVSFGGFT